MRKHEIFKINSFSLLIYLFKERAGNYKQKKHILYIGKKQQADNF